MESDPEAYDLLSRPDSGQQHTMPGNEWAIAHQLSAAATRAASRHLRRAVRVSLCVAVRRTL